MALLTQTTTNLRRIAVAPKVDVKAKSNYRCPQRFRFDYDDDIAMLSCPLVHVLLQKRP